MTPEAMAALHARCFPDRPWSAEEFAGLLQTHGVHDLSSPREDGILLARMLPPEAEILTLAVAPEARRQGVARGLLGELLDIATGTGVTRIFLEVDADNAAARSLYETHGFVETGRRRNYYRRADGTHTDALLLARAPDTAADHRNGCAAPPDRQDL